MGGKSSKANDKFIDKALQQSQSERRRTPRSKTPPTPAWGKNSNRSVRESDQRNYDRERKGAQVQYERNNTYDTSWGKTSFNLLDLHQYQKLPSSQSHQDLSGGNINFNKFKDFHNITDKRDEKEKRDQLRREEDIRNKPDSVISSPKKPFSVHNSSSKPKRRNSLPLDKNQHENKHPRNHKPYSKSSPPKKKLSIRQPDSAERRISDVSTISLSENTVPPNSSFKSIKKTKNSSYGGSKSSKAAVSVYAGKNTNNNYSPKKRYSDKSVEKRINTPPKVHLETLKPTNNGKRQPPAFSRLNSLTIGSSAHSFANIASIKSANSINSVQSNRSNFETPSKIETFLDKKTSLSMVGLSSITRLSNQFKELKYASPDAAYAKACKDLQSSEWETQASAVEMIVTIARKNPEVLKDDLKNTIRLVMGAANNLRSQVCKPAIQAFGELYLILGRAMEMDIDKVVTLLLTKSADTNRFLREASGESLTAMAENVTVFRALSAIITGGINHKSVVVKTEVARLYDLIVTQLGPMRVFGSSKEFLELLFPNGAKLLLDGAIQVRTHAKHAFGELIRHEKFEAMTKEYLRENERRDIKKTLDSIK